MNLRNLLSALVLMTTAIAYAQEETTVRVTHFPGNTLVDGVSKFVAPEYIRLQTTGQNCFDFLDVAVYVRASGEKANPYKFKVEVTNRSSYSVNVATSMWGLGNGGSNTIRSGSTYNGQGGNNYNEKYPSIKIYQIKIDFNRSAQEQYGVPSITKNLNCGENPNSYINKKKAEKEKKEEITTLKNKVNALGNSEADLIEKIALYRELQRKDPYGNYENQISRTEKSLERLKTEEKEAREAEEKKEREEAREAEKKEEEDKEKDAAEEKAREREKAATARERQERKQREAEEAEKRRAAARKQARREYENRVAQQNKQNRAIASATAASSAGVLYMLAGIIYQGSGRAKANRIYQGEGLYFGLDFGYTGTLTNIGFNSKKTVFDRNDNASTQDSFTDYGIFNINFDFNPKFGYETENYGGYGYGTLRAGFSPIFDSFGLSYDLGARAYGGLEWVKGFVDYQFGSRSFSANAWVDAEEVGSGKANYNFNRFTLGTQFSWYGNARTAARNHIAVGIMYEKVTNDEEGLFVQTLEGDDRSDDTPNYIGYSFEWKHDHHGTLFLEYFPAYPVIGNTEGSVRNSDFDSEGYTFIQIGYTRSVDNWFTK
jgi:hypothetical protein